MSPCTPTCRPASGTRFEHCRACHMTFGGASLGDAHRITVDHYTLASETLSSPVHRFYTGEDVPDGWKIASIGNVVRRCLTDVEMRDRGWRLVDQVWRGPKSDVEWWRNDDLGIESLDADLDPYFEKLRKEDSEGAPQES